MTYANQMYDLCQHWGIDYEQVRACAEADPMVAACHLNVMHSGYRGFGGKCLPKDVRTMTAVARSYGAPTHLLSLLVEAQRYNDMLLQQEAEAPPTGGQPGDQL